MKRKPYEPRLLKPHVGNCYAIANAESGTWNSPWYIPFDLKAECRDSLGRKRGGIFGRWYTLNCNCDYCQAQITVHEDTLLKQVPRG